MAEVKINRNKRINMFFKDIKVGQVFEYKDELYLCIDEAHIAVVLSENVDFGCVTEFYGDEYVHVFENAEIIVNLNE